MRVSRSRRLRPLIGAGLLALAVVYAFPIFYMVLSSFKNERDVAPPRLAFVPTLDNYREVINPDLVQHLTNSIVITLCAVALTALLGVPIAYVIVYGRLRKPTSRYNWYVTTTLLPAVAVIMPLYVIVTKAGLLDSRALMVLLYTATGVPLLVWMCVTYMMDVPVSIIEAARIDGCDRWQAFRYVIFPAVRGGVASALMLVFVVTWNEFLFATAYTFTQAGTLPVFMNRYMTQQGLFWGKMSAAATIAILIPVILGFFAQKSLIKGLLTGAVKE
ncbi:MAG: carbohydrate ABC transporter permease [Bifidobacteriaceae bacterium]|nr:carbohydrate ABC transporter permease [Bifidobacteriaceae bacterium]